MSDLPTVITELRRLLVKLERLSAHDGRSLEQQITDVLVDGGPLTTQAIARLIARRRADVLSTLDLMAAAGRVLRDGGPGTPWRLS